MSRGTDARELTEELQRSQDQGKDKADPWPAAPNSKVAKAKAP
jgi:hypothetical protein